MTTEQLSHERDRALHELLEECGRQRCELRSENDDLRSLLKRSRGLHTLPWKERISLQDEIDEAVAR